MQKNNGSKPSRNIMHGSNMSKRGHATLRGLPSRGRAVKSAHRDVKARSSQPSSRRADFGDTTVKASMSKSIETPLHVYETRFTIPNVPQNGNIVAMQVQRQSIAKALLRTARKYLACGALPTS